MEDKNYILAFKNCKLACEVYSKPVKVINEDLFDCIRYDLENRTNTTIDYCIGAKADAEWYLETIVG